MKITKKTTKRIWTIGYRPFVMGGSVHYNMACDIKCDGPFDLGDKYKGYLAIAPNGKTFVAEYKSGAIVGDTIENVKNDILTGDKEMMEKQVKDAIESSKKVEVVSEDYFWEALKAI